MRTLILSAVGVVLAACASTTVTPAPQVISFTVSPNPVERGSDVRVQWHVTGTTHATLWPLTYDSKTGQWYRMGDPISTGSTIGEHRLTVPGDANQTLRFQLEATDAAGNTETATSDEIRLVCHPIFFEPRWSAWCPSAPQTTTAAFQPFEGGYMIWRGDTRQVYVLRQSTTRELPSDWLAFFPTEEPASIDVPSGRFAPGQHFQDAWASLPEYWRSLGRAVASEQVYTLTSQLSFSPYGRGTGDDLYLSWPDGRIAHLLVYLGAPNHANGPAWSFVNSNATPAVIPPTGSTSEVPPSPISVTPENNAYGSPTAPNDLPASVTYRVSGLP
jgi:hypothetical protein